jgi:hypothetical protein
MASRIERLDVHGARLEIPLSDFDELPRRLGCSLKRGPLELVLADSQPSCELHFDVDGDLAVLTRIDVRDDADGRFVSKVLGALLKEYEGDLDAELEWSPRRKTDGNLLVLGGKTTHRLLSHAGTSPRPAELENIDVTRLELLLLESRAAWEEYRRLRTRDAGRSGTKA